MTNFDILRKSLCTTNAKHDGFHIDFKFKSSEDMHRGFESLMDLITAELKRIDSAIDKPIDIGAEIVNVEPVNDIGCEHASQS